MKFAFIQKRHEGLPSSSFQYLQCRCEAIVNSIPLMPDQIQPNITKDNECPGVWYTQISGKNSPLRNGVWFRDRYALRKAKGSGSRNSHRIIRISPVNYKLMWTEHELSWEFHGLRYTEKSVHQCSFRNGITFPDGKSPTKFWSISRWPMENHCVQDYRRNRFRTFERP